MRRGAIDTSDKGDGSGYGFGEWEGHLLAFGLASSGGGFGGGALEAERFWSQEAAKVSADLLAFIADRLKVQLRDQGKRHDLVDAVFALGDDDLVRIVARVEALAAFLKTEDGANLLAGHKRATNILAAEDKKGQGVSADWVFDAKALKEPAEMALAEALDQTEAAVKKAVAEEDFAAAMKALSVLRAPVDGFFEAVLVNAEDPLLRRNRLMLLSRIRDVCRQVADFAKIEG